MGYLIDTSVLIRFERQRLSFDDLLKEQGTEDAGISVITAVELLHGVHRADNSERRLIRNNLIEEIFSKISVYPIDMEVARRYAAIWAQLQDKGINLGAHDLLIGCTALELGFILLTVDKKDFSRIPDLQVKFL